MRDKTKVSLDKETKWIAITIIALTLMCSGEPDLLDAIIGFINRN
jgi:hypothetical protein